MLQCLCLTGYSGLSHCAAPLTSAPSAASGRHATSAAPRRLRRSTINPTPNRPAAVVNDNAPSSFCVARARVGTCTRFGAYVRTGAKARTRKNNHEKRKEGSGIVRRGNDAISVDTISNGAENASGPFPLHSSFWHGSVQAQQKASWELYHLPSPGSTGTTRSCVGHVAESTSPFLS